ncbi:hypothetical protein SLA2020_001600 [Shorea laevis]
MIFGPWMVQQRKPQRKNSVSPHTTNSHHAQSPTSLEPPNLTPRIPAKSKVVKKHVGNNVHQARRQNHFEVIVEVMEEEIALLGATKGKEVVTVGDSAPLNAIVMPMDTSISPSPSEPPPAQTHVTSGQLIEPLPIPPPAESTLFIKPKSKPSKKKNKILGPMHKETKASAQKPYTLPVVSKKQSSSTPQMQPSIQTVSSAPHLVSSAKDNTPIIPSPPIPHTMSLPQDLPLTSTPSSSPPTVPIFVTGSMPLQAGNLGSSAVISGTATLSSTPSQ